MSNRSFIILFILSISLGYLIKLTCFSVQRVSGHSMEPTLKDGSLTFSIERPLMNLLDLNLAPGDIVVFEKDNWPPGIKRLTGLENDKIWVENYSVFRNGKLFREKRTDLVLTNKIVCRYSEIFTVPKDHVFLIGDNLCNSLDSRMTGPVKKEDVKRKVLYVWFNG